VAHAVFNVPTRVARIRSAEFKDKGPLLSKEGFAVDRVICPEDSVTRYIHQLIEHPEALQVVNFSQGRAYLVAVRVSEHSDLAGSTIGAFAERHPEVEMRIVAVYRIDFELSDAPDTVVRAGDEVFVIVERDNVRHTLRVIAGQERAVRRVMIAGGGRVGLRLARSLESDYEVKIIEHDRQRCEQLAHELHSGATLVLHGDVSDEEMLTDENVGDMDLFLALTNDDEDNILASMLAKRLGARRVLALINRRAYADMMQGSTIDIAVSPAHAVIGELLADVRRGAVAAVHSLRRGTAEALEGVVHGDARTSKLVGKRVDQLKLPRGARMGAIVRGAGDECRVLMPHHDSVIETGDHVIIFMAHKRMLRDVEKLFQVSATFM
jgi:trk system potassium uptake protein TrkA